MVEFNNLVNEEVLKKIVAGSIKPGSIYLAKFTIEDGVIVPHQGDDYRYKYFIVIGVDSDFIYGCVLINSNPRRNELLQYPIPQSIYQLFKNKVSYADCSILKEIPISKFAKATFVGNLTDEDLRYIIGTICGPTNVTISKATLKRFNINL